MSFGREKFNGNEGELVIKAPGLVQEPEGEIIFEAPSLVQEPEDGFIEAPGLVQEPDDEFVIEAPGLVQELLVAEVHAPLSPSLVSPIVPPTENPPSVLQPQPCSPPHMPVPLLTCTPHHSHKSPSKKPQFRFWVC